MAEKRSQKGGPQRVKNLQIAMPLELHTAMKIRAAERQMTVKGYVIEAIRQAIEKGGKSEKK